MVRNIANCAASLTDRTAPIHGAGTGATPSAALSNKFRPKEVRIAPVPNTVARELCENLHYLKSYPGGVLFNFGVFVHSNLLGVAVFSAGPSNIHCFFQDAKKNEIICLARFWLDDCLGRNCESRALAIIVRLLKLNTSIKAVIAYSDPLAGHSGIIYRAAGFLYVGQSSAMPLYRLPDGSIHHSRSLAHCFGTHSTRYFADHEIKIELIQQARKLTYIALVDQSWRPHLRIPILSYCKEQNHENP